jgi:hypothetical protein
MHENGDGDDDDDAKRKKEEKEEDKWKAVGCPVCHEPWTALPPTDPRILSCAHSFCGVCIDRMMMAGPPNSELVCPVCRQSTHFDNVSPNHGLIGLLVDMDLYTQHDPIEWRAKWELSSKRWRAEVELRSKKRAATAALLPLPPAPP